MTIIIESFTLGYWHRRDGGEPFRDREDARRFIERLRAYDHLGDYRIIETDDEEFVPPRGSPSIPSHPGKHDGAGRPEASATSEAGRYETSDPRHFFTDPPPAETAEPPSRGNHTSLSAGGRRF